MAERENTLFGEIRRMARTSGAVGGIAARVAGERFLGIKTDKAAHAEDLKSILGGLKGPLMKVAQFLSTVPNALPEEYAQQLASLQANAPPMGWAFVRRRMGTELGPAWETNFKEFGREAAAAASLGQVHRALLPDGTRVACKLQYPDMPSVVEADLRQLRMAMGLYARMDNTIQHDDVYEELRERLREELDYEREAAQMRMYGIMLRDVAQVHVPSPVQALTTKRLLTMTWLEGRSILARLEENPSLEERNAYAKALFHAWYVPLYRYGVIHGDPHLGNYQVRQPGPDGEGGINLLDFGAIRVFPPRFITGTLTLYEAVRDEDRDKAAHAFELWGFKDLKRETMEVLLRWARFLYEPLLEDRVRPVQETNDPQFGRKVAEEVHAGLKRVGGVRPPREFVLMDRAAVGLGSVFLRLKAEMNWHNLFHELIDDYREADLAARQAAALADAGVPPTETPAV
ncbi:Predicted unusual protein kinase regulating ubiquinone biosynthesis, AarF/ABC1/UbiB family [Roseomonas rosea]|uniref:Predicted unusual protein kinase regulating ubiquinone biosynthesis, AarF/ABC1/UbiB family n=1 Tax=Muricoccus roseus TaxID=198092 RepID=A0A1M6JVT6_9PROT|nr:AarF/ABC1/UbiB kinase family protein [Roseomonas rosea]SHJ50768.1 Predicted unusual protein kinase regulating ubiquinone biosynthesis, AarF/ABC1/UbiB family [Roseomonas rosea]